MGMQPVGIVGADTMVLGLQQDERRSGESHCDHRVGIITDKAKYHIARPRQQWRKEHADQFVCDGLPAYSPELNPNERVGKLTCRRCLHNRPFASLDDAIPPVENEFAHWIKPNNPRRRQSAVN